MEAQVASLCLSHTTGKLYDSKRMHRSGTGVPCGSAAAMINTSSSAVQAFLSLMAAMPKLQSCHSFRSMAATPISGYNCTNTVVSQVSGAYIVKEALALQCLDRRREQQRRATLQAGRVRCLYRLDIATADCSHLFHKFPCDLPKALLVTLLSKQIARGWVPETRQQDLNLQRKPVPVS